MISTPNTVSGTLQLISKIIAQYDDEPDAIESELRSFFTKNLGAGLVNMRRFSGFFTPANNILNIASFVTTEDPKIFLLFTSKAIGLQIQYVSIIDGALSPVNPLLIDGLYIYMVKKFRDAYLQQITLNALTAVYNNPADIEQGVEISYDLFTFEEA